MEKRVSTSVDELDAAEKSAAQEIGHPRGTLVIVTIFGGLFALGWIAMYVWRFLGRGAPHS